MITETITIIASIAAILGLYQFFLFLRKYFYRPIISIGILPVDEIKRKKLSISDIGKRTGPDEIQFYQRMFAPQIDDNEIDEVINFSNNTTRKVIRKDTDEYDLPIIIYNHGKSTLKDYKLNVSFSEILSGSFDTDTNLQLLDVETETASVDGLYVDKNTYQGERNRTKIPSLAILGAYKTINLSAHFVTFRGELGSGMYEMIYIKLLVPKNVNRFAMYYEIDTRGEVPRAKRYGQYIEISDKIG